jgi:hypothetical protein
MTSEQEGIGIHATAGRGGPEPGVFEQFQAHSLGFIDGMNAMQAGGPYTPRRRRSRGRQLTDAEWDEYRRGWDEALDAYDTDNG